MEHSFFTNLLIIIIAFSELLLKVFEVVNFFFQSQVQSKYCSSGTDVFEPYHQLFKDCPCTRQSAIDLVWCYYSDWHDTKRTWLYLCISKRRIVLSWTFDKSVAGSLLRESWPLALYGIALHIQAKIDQVMLGKMLNNYVVGQYSVALKLSRSLVLLQ